MPRTPLISAPAAEQSVVSPFLLRRRPSRRSPAFAAVFGSPLSGSPIPGSHADVTILLPGNGPQSPGAPTNTNGTARSPSSSSRSANAGAAGTTATITTAIKIRILNIIALPFESRTSSLDHDTPQRMVGSIILPSRVETVWLYFRVVLPKVNAQRCDAASVRTNVLPTRQRVPTTIRWSPGLRFTDRSCTRNHLASNAVHPVLVERLWSWRKFLCRLHGAGRRSEEHTSELQSRLHLVCRLLLEKK